MSEPRPFSPDALRQSVEALPPEQGGIGAVATPGDVGLAGSVKRDIGKPGGWWIGATGHAWLKAKDYAASVWLGWSGK